MPQAQIKVLLDSVIWGFKHVVRDIADLGLSICLEMINNYANVDASIANPFWHAYYLSLLQDVFFVLTDTDHKSSFKLQCQVLARLFNLVDSDLITVPLWQREGDIQSARGFLAGLSSAGGDHYILLPVHHVGRRRGKTREGQLRFP